MEKLGIDNRVELARYAIREGIADVWVMAATCGSAETGNEINREDA
jgi:hypothetical protein